MEFSSAVLAPS